MSEAYKEINLPLENLKMTVIELKSEIKLWEEETSGAQDRTNSSFAVGPKSPKKSEYFFNQIQDSFDST
jgi:hypothetical protein